MEQPGSGLGKLSCSSACPPNPASAAQQQLSYQRILQQQQQQLQAFWEKQYAYIERLCDFKNHSLPLARIKKVIKSDGDVKMISAEAPVVFARACDMFILELTLRSWNHTEENKRRTLQKNDIAAAIMRTDVFDFLVDIVPREDLNDDRMAAFPRGTVPAAAVPTDGFPYYYMPEAHSSPQGVAGGTVVPWSVVDPNAYPQPGQPSVPPTVRPPHSKPSSSKN